MGYNSDEVVLPVVPTERSQYQKDGVLRLDPSTTITHVRPSLITNRPPVAASLGPHIAGAALPHPSLTDTATAMDGAAYRFARYIEYSELNRPRFRAFVRKYIRKHYVPLTDADDLTYETWIEGTPYATSRKLELTRKKRECSNIFDPKHQRVKSFIKDEHYICPKHARPINSRTDEYKCAVGPVLQKISDAVFADPAFIKKVPIDQRAQVIVNDLWSPGCKVFSTDFSSFEAHFNEILKEECEYELYDYFLSKRSDGDHLLSLLKEKDKLNDINFKNFVMQINAKKMSGEMDTSLSNGFTNLMIIKFNFKESGAKKLRVKVEGDDGLGTHFGEAPTAESWHKFGLSLKIESHADLCSASFCGMIFDMKDRTNVSDPRKVLASFGWTSAKYTKSRKNKKLLLLRCKALSLAYQYPSCPILSQLAKKMLQLTAGFDVEGFVNKQGTQMMDQYKLSILRMALMKQKSGGLLFSEPGYNTRLLVENQFGISINEQLIIEAYIDAIEVICPLNHPIIHKHMDREWIDYYERYNRVIHLKNEDIQHYPPVWPALRDKTDFSAVIGARRRKTNCRPEVQRLDLF